MAPPRGLRAQAREAVELHKSGQHEEALARAGELFRANPDSALALNLLGSLHRESGSAAWKARASYDDEAALDSKLHHHRLALYAFSAAARIAPDCVMTAIAHGEALAACGRFVEAQVELDRIRAVPEADHVDPAVHHVGYDQVVGGSTAKTRKREAMFKAKGMQDFEAVINNEIVPMVAAKLFGGDVAADEVRKDAKLISECYPFSPRAQLLCMYFELEHVRALDVPADRKRHLRRILALVSDAAVVFDRSLLIALFHAKILFVLDEFGVSERECRRALCIEDPTDPNLDDIPPAVYVDGADCDARVASVKRELRVFLKHIIVVASIKNTQHHEGIISVKTSCADEALKADEKCEESEVRAVDRNYGNIVDQSSSDPPTDVDESVMNIAAGIAEVELDKKGISGQSVKEIASTSSYQQSRKVLNKNNADKDLSVLSLIIRSLCNLRRLRDKLLTEPPVWIPSVDSPCIAQKFYEIFYSWEKNDHDLTDVVLSYLKTLLCGIVDCATFDEKLQSGTNFASEIVATILIGLHMSETCSRFSLNKETEKDVVNPITCRDCICPTHNLFGIKFDAQMNCKCGKSSGEYLYTALFHKLDAGSPQTTKIKSFAELPVLLDEQFCKDNTCEECGTLLNIDLFLSNTPHFFTIVLNWLGTSESQDTLSEVLAGITSPVDTGFFCKSADTSTTATMYTVTSMVQTGISAISEEVDKGFDYDTL